MNNKNAMKIYQIPKNEKFIKTYKLFDEYRIHKSIWQSFNKKDGEKQPFVFTNDNPNFIYVYSDQETNGNGILSECDCKELNCDNLQRELGFKVKFNPRKSDRNNSNKKLAILDEETQREWLEKRLKEKDISLIDYSMDRYKKNVHVKNIVVYSVYAEGRIKFNDPVKLAQFLCAGIGSAKHLGNGLMLLTK